MPGRFMPPPWQAGAGACTRRREFHAASPRCRGAHRERANGSHSGLPSVTRSADVGGFIALVGKEAELIRPGNWDRWDGIEEPSLRFHFKRVTSEHPARLMCRGSTAEMRPQRAGEKIVFHPLGACHPGPKWTMKRIQSCLPVQRVSRPFWQRSHRTATDNPFKTP